MENSPSPAARAAAFAELDGLKPGQVIPAEVIPTPVPVTTAPATTVAVTKAPNQGAVLRLILAIFPFTAALGLHHFVKGDTGKGVLKLLVIPCFAIPWIGQTIVPVFAIAWYIVDIVAAAKQLGS